MSLLTPFTTLALYLKSVQDEAKKVTWPSKKETIKKTTTVIVACLIVGGVIGFYDFILNRLIALLIQ